MPGFIFILFCFVCFRISINSVWSSFYHIFLLDDNNNKKVKIRFHDFLFISSTLLVNTVAINYMNVKNSFLLFFIKCDVNVKKEILLKKNSKIKFSFNFFILCFLFGVNPCTRIMNSLVKCFVIKHYWFFTEKKRKQKRITFIFFNFYLKFALFIYINQKCFKMKLSFL